MFHIVPPDQYQLPAAVDAGGIDHCETWLASARAAEPPHEVSDHTEHRECDDEGDQEFHRNRQVVEELHRSAPLPRRCDRFDNSPRWQGLCAPKNTPADITIAGIGRSSRGRTDREPQQLGHHPCHDICDAARSGGDNQSNPSWEQIQPRHAY